MTPDAGLTGRRQHVAQNVQPRAADVEIAVIMIAQHTHHDQVHAKTEHRHRQHGSRKHRFRRLEAPPGLAEDAEGHEEQ